LQSGCGVASYRAWTSFARLLRGNGSQCRCYVNFFRGGSVDASQQELAWLLTDKQPSQYTSELYY